MTDHPIDLDGRRTAEGKLQIRMRRPANTRVPPQAERKSTDAKIDAALRAGSAHTLSEAIDLARFRLERSSATGAPGARVQALIGRVLSDLTRSLNPEDPDP